MMVGILGGGLAHIRLADGSATPSSTIKAQRPRPPARRRMTPDPNAPPGTMDTIGRKNAVGPERQLRSPGNLKGWCEALDRFGTFSRADVMEPAIRHASRGYPGHALSA